MDELRVVARYAAEAALEVLPVFEQTHPEDARPRAAVEAAQEFVGGAKRSVLQRSSAADAHRAAKEATTEATTHAAYAAGDAAAAAYLHPLAQATQVRHILRSAAHAARASELIADGDVTAGHASIERARLRAAPELIAVLRRYPLAPTGRTRVAELMTRLDTTLRST